MQLKIDSRTGMNKWEDVWNTVWYEKGSFRFKYSQGEGSCGVGSMIEGLIKYGWHPDDSHQDTHEFKKHILEELFLIKKLHINL